MTESIRAVRAAYALALLYPLLSLLWRHSHPLLTPETLLAFFAIAVVAWVLAWLHVRIDHRIAAILLALPLVLAGMMQFDLGLAGIAAVLVVVAVSGGLLGRRFTPLLLPILLAMMAGAWLDARSERRAHVLDAAVSAQGPAPVIHLLMDSFSGPAGFPAGAAGQAVARETSEFLAEWGFAEYPRAYSRYSSTVDSLRYAMNFEQGPISHYTNDLAIGTEHRFAPNRYFDALKAHGYRIRVYQNEEMLFCDPGDAAFAACWTHPLPNLESSRMGLGSATLRLQQILSAMLRRSRILGAMLDARGWLPPFGVSTFEPAMIGQLVKDVTAHPRGTAYFAHVLFPHSPWTFDEACRHDYDGPPQTRYSRYGGEVRMSEELRRARTGRYLAQTRCALRVLERLFRELDHAGVLDTAHIVIHGDHGPQITPWPMRTVFMDALTRDDYRQAFSILYAYRTPGGAAAQRAETMPLEALLFDTANRITGNNATAGSGEPGIYLLGENPMPFIPGDPFSAE